MALYSWKEFRNYFSQDAKVHFKKQMWCYDRALESMT